MLSQPAEVFGAANAGGRVKVTWGWESAGEEVSFVCTDEMLDPDKVLRIGPAERWTPVGTESLERGFWYELRKRRMPLLVEASTSCFEDDPFSCDCSCIPF
jgi:hypothetical protein